MIWVYLFCAAVLAVVFGVGVVAGVALFAFGAPV